MKEYIIRLRDGGKTTAIVEKVRQNNAYLLTSDENEKQRLIKTYPDLKERIFSWKSLPESMLGKEKRPVYIDNADYWLAELVPNYRIEGASFTIE